MDNRESILKFLEAQSMNKNVKKDDPLVAIVDFLNNEVPLDIINMVINRIQSKIDFHYYFTSMDNINELKSLKDSDPVLYYQVIYYETILINIICKAMEMPYTVVLKPEDLDDSYYLVIKFK